ncbi:hypothetical protein ACIA6E_28975 [Streptomyces sp. NPDC051815]
MTSPSSPLLPDERLAAWAARYAGPDGAPVPVLRDAIDTRTTELLTQLAP